MPKLSYPFTNFQYMKERLGLKVSVLVSAIMV
jgi:hypothetical protein